LSERITRLSNMDRETDDIATPALFDTADAVKDLFQSTWKAGTGFLAAHH